VKCGSLFTGIEGLDMAVCAHFGAEVAWVSEVEKPLLDRFTVPNLGDVTKVDWSEVEPVDVLCGGYPCQPFSSAGRRQGFDDPRDCWPAFARAIRILRPHYVVAENVAGHLRLGFQRTLSDLAEMGFDARWGTVRAADAGAPHRRERLFVLAWSKEAHPDSNGFGPHRASVHEHGRTEQGRAELRDGQEREPGPLGAMGGGRPFPAADPSGERLGEHTGEPPTQEARTEAGNELATAGRGRADSVGGPATDSDNGRCEQRDESERGLPESRPFDFGPYEPAIARWERVVNRSAPVPVDDRKRLNPPFVEWMMGFPEGWVDGLSRTQALKALGNAVVPQQAARALQLLDGILRNTEKGVDGE
jgi:DNA (cytosine-5)-methyltransferase 1